ncbi:MAG TPA: LytTR family DNA-binding domain-containing protein [Verrucomicrobiae bacterium]|jgi:two-component system LytT family response regulator|nr:LytTR family DNA-binding domain-containing protein [Verrucomicrobiae bacterium]
MHDSTQLRILIVDDESVARERLRRLISNVERAAVITESADGFSAASALRTHAFDLILLDVQMPEMSGFDVVRAIGPDQMPPVIFVTAFDRFALQAFDAQALDYLLKPFGEDRVRQALARARTFLTGAGKLRHQKQMTGLLSMPERTDCLLVKDGARVLLLRPQEIDWVEANGDYVRLHAGSDSHFIRATMTQMEDRLGGKGFVRIHRSRLVNVDRIKELRPLLQGESVVVLKNGARLNASQSCLKQLQDRFHTVG